MCEHECFQSRIFNVEPLFSKWMSMCLLLQSFNNSLGTFGQKCSVTELHDTIALLWCNWKGFRGPKEGVRFKPVIRSTENECCFLLRLFSSSLFVFYDEEWRFCCFFLHKKKMGKNNHSNNNLLISSLISLQMIEATKRAGAWFAAVATYTNTATHQEMKVKKRKEIILRKKDERKEMNQPTTTTFRGEENLKCIIWGVEPF